MLSLLGGCLLDDQAATTERSAIPIDENLPPSISGIPGSSTIVGEMYTFTPVASDPNGDVLTFGIQNKPLWADFDSGTGSVTGVPNLGDEGIYSNISMTVSDGKASSSLPQFSVAVNQFATGSTTLSWTAPTQNTDGSPLTDLVAYKIYYGLSQGNYPNQVRIDNPGITTYFVDNLSPNTYYFVATSFNVAGIESDFSNMAVKTVN
jgi:hypothetical protein